MYYITMKIEESPYGDVSEMKHDIIRILEYHGFDVAAIEIREV